ncbi:MAG TPA: tRNA (adenosine(37)-N6)-threonylcarbamoyltransferase complex transferase subunit TsaD [Patescibacteria group bacterium]|nr:tRNA (adenosine(37)-N6)-threonylcarbamoyltransferase complex transferase subunit TsaD [Patescibacteria group bacterium]
MNILAIESSCDESAASVVFANKKNKEIKVKSNVISSQIKLHAKYGGVVPELAAREHVYKLLPTIDNALKEAECTIKDINLIAVTKGPGLVTSLLTGTETARTLAYANNIPIIGINHIEGHLFAPFINNWKNIKFPAVILTVSGGHSNIVLMQSPTKYRKLGSTRDDAAGEAFDKGAKMMSLGYPGGPIISKKAQEFEKSKKKQSLKDFPRPMKYSDNLDFSFSGLKTSLLYRLKKDKNWKNNINEYCYLYQEAIVDVLVTKTIKAAKKHLAKSVLLSGGVSANIKLREELTKKAQDKHLQVFISDLQYTTDNAAMIAAASVFNKKIKDKASLTKLKNSWKVLSVQENLD